ncbi:MAG: PPOX class probable F420-dependent enzyme [Candidatus Poriferisodalaceae bacterium]|jgi:PPOX class probable F420-dependent enzyme
MSLDPRNLSPEATEFLTERHLATLTLIRPDGTPHVAPVGVTWDAEAQLARIITWGGSNKARLLTASGASPAAVCQVDGGRWLTIEGVASVLSDPARCAEAVARYAERYRQPKDRGSERRVIEIAVTRMMGRA